LVALVAVAHLSGAECRGCKVAAQIFPQQSEPLSPLSSPTILSSSNPTIDCTADLNGDGVNDFLILLTRYDPATGKMTCGVKAKDGKTGAKLWYQGVKEQYCFVGVCLAGDLDGDALEDVLIDFYKYNGTTGVGWSIIKAKKGSDGTLLWRQYYENTTAIKCLTKCCCYGWWYYY